MLGLNMFDKTNKIVFNGEEFHPSKREVYKEVRTGAWDHIWFCHVKKGDHIKLKDPDGTFIQHEDGREDFVAKSNAYIDDLGILCFDI